MAASTQKLVDRQKLPSLDGLRGIAASWVVFHHMSTNGLLPSYPLLSHGYYFVDMFFVLSGFVLSYQYADRIGSRSDFIVFVRKRFARIWPLHATILLAMALPRFISLALHGPSGNELLDIGGDHDILSLGASLLFLHAAGFYTYAVWNGPSWTLSVEFWTYIIFGLLALTGAARLVRWSYIIVLASATILITTGMFADTGMRFALLRCLFGFFIGVSAMTMFKPTSGGPSAVLSSAIEIGLVLLLGWLMVQGGPYYIAFVVVSALLTLQLAHGQGVVAWLLRQAPFQYLGAWSLGIYLLHIPLLNILFRLSASNRTFGLDFSPAGWGLPESVVFVSSVLVLAALAHIAIERPARAWIGSGKMFSSRRQTAPGSAN